MKILQNLNKSKEKKKKGTRISFDHHDIVTNTIKQNYLNKET